MPKDTIVETIRADDPRFGDAQRRYVRLRVLLDRHDWRDYTRDFYKSGYLPDTNTPLLSEVQHPSLSVSETINQMFFEPSKMLEQLNGAGNSVCIRAITEGESRWSCLIMNFYNGTSWSLNNAMENAIDLFLDDGGIQPMVFHEVGELQCQ